MTTVSPSRPPVFNLPNQLTAARFVLAIVLFSFISFSWWIGCLIVFVAAAITDWLDGYLARKQGLTSTLGRNLDPLVDKVLICGAFTFLVPFGNEAGWMTPWMVTLVVARELIITSLRSFLENQGAVFGADWLGKIKMVLQCAALIAIFVAQKMPEWVPESAPVFDLIRIVLIYVMLVATALSGLQYFWKAAVLLRTDPSAENRP
jgi:CDP-diacylglycerol--glycerol-3-phosphate 3-phosphatidyltransferase